jgi:cytochrome c5
MACHVTGAAQAPKTGDTEAWTPRAEKGLDALVETVLKGKGAMPPNGGNPALTEAEIRRGVVYLLEQAGLGPG